MRRRCDFVRFSARESGFLRQCSSVAAHPYVVTQTDFQRLKAWVRFELDTKFDRLKNHTMQAAAIAKKKKKEVPTSPHMRPYTVSTLLIIMLT